MPKRSTTRYLVKRLRYSALLASKAVVHRACAAIRSPTQKRVAFVGGIQRSGTNMIMEALERSFATDVYHERDPRAFVDYQMRPLDTIQALVAASPAPFVVVKALCELQDFGRLLDAFAPAKGIWMIRRYGDMINSHMKLWRGCPATLGAMVDDPLAGAWRGRGMSASTRAILARHHRPDMSDASAVALFWYIRNALFFEQKFETDPRVAVVRYESLVQNPETQFRRLFAFLDIPFHPRVMQGLHASSVGREAAPAIDPAIRELCDGLVRRFEPLILA